MAQATEPEWLLTTCGGPVSDHGICGWCGKVAAVGVDRCAHDWPERPIGNVIPKFKPITIMAMRVDCWACDTVIDANSIQHGPMVEGVARGGRCQNVCPKCGAGLSIQQIGGGLVHVEKPRLVTDPSAIRAAHRKFKRK